MPNVQTPIKFHPVTPDLAPRYRALAALYPSQSADHSFTNLYIWNETYHQNLAFIGERVAVSFRIDGKTVYLFPIGVSPLHETLETLREGNSPLTLVGVTEEELAELLALYPDAKVTETRDIFDYLYSAEKLETLSGKKLHAKRNHVNAFAAAHDFTVKPLNGMDFSLCFEIFNAWATGREGASIENERRALSRALDAYDALSLEGALLLVGDVPVAFTVGSFLTPDTLCVHFEKALPDYNGAFPTINREFVRMMRAKFPALTTVNREDDMGLESLRAAKLSYRPTALLRKFTVTV